MLFIGKSRFSWGNHDFHKKHIMFPRKTVHEALVYGQVRHAHAAHHMRLATERHGLALVVEIAREVPWTDGAPSP